MAGGEDDISLLHTQPWTPTKIASVDGVTSALPTDGGLATSRHSVTYPLPEQGLEGSRAVLRPAGPFKDGQQGIPPPPEDLTSLSPQPTNRATKRPRSNETRMPFPRKRAVAACQLCRSRKTKCDNQRPSCSSCYSLKARCVYQDASSDFSSSVFDQASLTILDRLNYSIQLMEGLSSVPTRFFDQSLPTTVQAQQGLEPITKTTTTDSHASNILSPTDLLDDNAATWLEALDVAANCSSARVLSWPIFEGSVNPDDITALFFDPENSQDNGTAQVEQSLQLASHSVRSRSGSSLGRGVREEDVPGLIHNFLVNVHVKNPILDPSALRSMAREVSDEGFKWDEKSCLVLIACALAYLAVPFELTKPEKYSSSLSDAQDYATAETYYTAARKRIGLLGNSVPATQCYFLIGVYEMYSLRPLRAWLSFNHACTTFQTCLHTRSRRVIGRSAKRLEQRLYWSCLKSECEMREEIDLPPTGLAKVDYPDVFPSPPGGTPEPEEYSPAMVWESSDPAFQQSWYYYLSEIASRRIGNRIIHALHSMPPHEWALVPLRRLQRIAEELDTQVLQWSENIPKSFAIGDEASSDELTFMLRARFIDFQERVWRPFLYIQVHTDLSAEDGATVKAYAQKCVELIQQFLKHTTVKHRHHGSWYGCRQVFTKALMLLAAVQSGNVEISSDWTRLIEMALNLLEYWEGEAPDLKVARLALADIYAKVSGSHQPQSPDFDSPSEML